jgi:hypothetical protein
LVSTTVSKTPEGCVWESCGSLWQKVTFAGDLK